MSNPSTPHSNPIMTFFSYEHLPPPMQAVSKPLHDVAVQMANHLSPSAEVSAGLRKLLEAKDCFVRAALVQHREELAARVPAVPVKDSAG